MFCWKNSISKLLKVVLQAYRNLMCRDYYRRSKFGELNSHVVASTKASVYNADEIRADVHSKAFSHIQISGRS